MYESEYIGVIGPGFLNQVPITILPLPQGFGPGFRVKLLNHSHAGFQCDAGLVPHMPLRQGLQASLPQESSVLPDEVFGNLEGLGLI